MADTEQEPVVATKAPESDAQAESLFPGDTLAQTGPSMGVRTREIADMRAERHRNIAPQTARRVSAEPHWM